MSRRLFVFALLAVVLAAVVLAGCRSTRVVTVPGETPAPTIVTETDTIKVWSDPDTVFLPPDTVRVYETVPYEVVRYLTPRPDTSRAFLLWQISVDSARVEIAGAASDASYRRPAPGERLRCVADGPSSLACRVEGEPVAPPVQRVECPAERDCIIAESPFGILQLAVLCLACAGLGLLAGRMLG